MTSDCSSYPLSGKMVVYSLSMERIIDSYKNPVIREALALFQPRKYLGIIQSCCETCYTQGSEAPKLAIMKPHFCVSASPLPTSSDYDTPDNRPILDIQPPLPWAGALAHTTGDIRAQLGHITKSETAHRLTPESLKRFRQYQDVDNEREEALGLDADMKKLTERTEQAVLESVTPLFRQQYENGSPAIRRVFKNHVSQCYCDIDIDDTPTAELAPPVPRILDISEDLTEVNAKVALPYRYHEEYLVLQQFVISLSSTRDLVDVTEQPFGECVGVAAFIPGTLQAV
ncbi:hypothetical protein CALVIDRAFT_551826 [Calocera viscosa TUFC12733]|uniref:Uncharacterized protein n=1 Tax=Calocera viscosa (strain TUFC12733) TaxID=1330018 RepID=A0A167RXP2_CALVF|nr:hypothetical protein CALVIDRAFT_551826 [Calocera viscosa TUFC12733]